MKRTLLLVLFCSLSVAALAASPPVKPKSSGPRPARDGARFLFVVDTSASMKSIDAATRQTVFDLIFSGVDGYMRTGDTFGIWTYNEQIGAGRYPMKVWDAENPVELASHVTMFVREQECQGDNRIEELMMKITAISRAASNVNVLIISDGDTKMQGTPADHEINAAYSQRNKERKAAKKPFITTLVVEGGKIVNGFVTLPGEPVALPPRPAPVAQVASIPPPATNAVTPSAPPPAHAANSGPSGKAALPPAVATIPTAGAPAPAAAVSKADSSSTPNIVTIDATTPREGILPVEVASSVASPITTNRPRKVMQITTLPSRPTAKPEEPVSVPAIDERKAEPAQAPTGTVVAASTLAPSSPNPTPPPSHPTAPEAIVPSVALAKPVVLARDTGLIAVVAPTPVVVAAREPSPPPPQRTTPPTVITAVQVPATPALGAIPTLIIGGILLAMALFLLGIALRRMRHEPQASLITQSMHRR